MVYYPAKAFGEGINPYDVGAYLSRYPAKQPFRGYPPATLLVYQPFAVMTLAAATVVYGAMLLVLTAALAWVSLRLGGLTPSVAGAMGLMGLILLSRPGHWNLMLGQVTLIAVLGTYGALGLARQRYLAAGLALAVTTLKPTYAVPLGLLMLARGQWASVAVGAGVSVAANLAVLALLAARAGGWASALSQIGGVTLPDPSDLATQYGVFRIDAIAMVSRFAGHQLHLAVAIAISGLILGVAAYVLHRRRSLEGDEQRIDQVAVGVACTGLLLSVYHMGYDLLLLVWPATALIARVRTSAAADGGWLRLALIAVLAANYLGTFAVLEAIGLGSPLALVLASLNSGALLLLFVLYLWDARLSST